MRVAIPEENVYASLHTPTPSAMRELDQYLSGVHTGYYHNQHLFAVANQSIDSSHNGSAFSVVSHPYQTLQPYYESMSLPAQVNAENCLPSHGTSALEIVATPSAPTNSQQSGAVHSLQPQLLFRLLSKWYSKAMFLVFVLELLETDSKVLWGMRSEMHLYMRSYSRRSNGSTTTQLRLPLLTKTN